VPSASETVVTGVIGQTVRLPCFYQVAQQSDISDMCWGRGPCPNSKCNNKILHTTRNRVTFRKSQRYNLQGYISNGDVSLTIGRVKAEDAGTYCCRIEIPGWFNDIKLNIRLEVVRAPPVMTTTTRKAPVSPKRFRKTTFAPQATSAHQTTTETDSPAVITLQTVAPPAFVVTENDAFPEAMVTISALPDFSTGFQAADLGTEDDIVLCPEESIPLPEVTPEFPGTLAALEGAISPYILPVVEDLPTAGISELLTTRATHSCMNRSEVKMLLKPFQFFFPPLQLPVHASLIASILVVSIAIILMLSLLCWKRKHTKKVIMRSVGPVEDLETVFSGTEGENSIHSL
ncbi:T-cell immunoglobulin and mucin domain-containing protein 4, partial [Merops nubicus]